MLGGCLLCNWRVFRVCLEGIFYMFGGCLEGLWRVSISVYRVFGVLGGYLEYVWIGSRVCL